MAPVHLFNVVPRLPEALSRLQPLAYDLVWSFDPELMSLFQRVDPDLFEATLHNPVALLGRVSQKRLDELAQDPGFLHHLEQAWDRYQAYLERTTWYAANHGAAPEAAPEAAPRPVIAYFSAEFGLARCLPIYSGGLGVLSGDHIKSASDLGLPLVGVGLLYQKGYFHQYLNPDGWQQERYEANDFFNMPLTLERGPDGEPLLISVEYPGRDVYAQVWQVKVGRARLYLMDTNIPRNQGSDQDITDYLYGGNREIRIQQEMMLGIGGVRLLAALGFDPVVYHMNEGHSAFLALERTRQVMTQHGLSFNEARLLCASSNVFTTHTAVPAGFDLFEAPLVEQYLARHLEATQLPFEAFMAMGRGDPSDTEAPLNMALLASRNANFINGVSTLHGEVTRGMFHAIVPEVPVHEIPIGSITNGVHTRSWTTQDFANLYDRYLGQTWTENPADPDAWDRAQEIPATELWRTHERGRLRLVTFARQRLEQQLRDRGASSAELEVAREVLDPDALTIGFARRFATYKRANLILQDKERLRRLLNHSSRPIQIVFAGKAHPKDDPGKRLIQEIVHFTEDPTVRRRMVFLEDYDLEVARHLVGGVDIWLNNPERPMEASGTSGMKVVFNGGLNLSILDGWWDEAFAPELGWAIGAGEEYADPEYRNRVESEAIYQILEADVVPLFYDRDANGLPREWIRKMRRSIAALAPMFNTHRMVREYYERYYGPAAETHARMAANGFAQAREQAAWLEQIGQHWSDVRVDAVRTLAETTDRPVGTTVTVEAEVHLGALDKDRVLVEAYAGLVDESHGIPHGQPHPLAWEAEVEPGKHRYRGDIPCDATGLHGFQCRVRPKLEGAPLLGTIRWE